MIPIRQKEIVIAEALKAHLGCEVIRANQNTPIPKYPYVSYTITTALSRNNGTWGEYEDGTKRKEIQQIWSFTVQSDDDTESKVLAIEAHDFFSEIGSIYLLDNELSVQLVGGITCRDNFITTGFEYRNGFDVTFAFMNEVNPKGEIIDSIQFGDKTITSDDEEMTYILQFKDGSEYVGVVVGEKTVFTATENDIRLGKTAATEEGITVGKKVIPSYHTTEGVKLVEAGERFTIELEDMDRYDYTKLQAIICSYDSQGSVSAEFVCIENKVYQVLSSVAVSSVTINSETKSIDLGFINASGVPRLIRYFTYKEVE